jgi:hypothetical protein
MIRQILRIIEGAGFVVRVETSGEDIRIIATRTDSGEQFIAAGSVHDEYRLAVGLAEMVGCDLDE